MSEFYEFTVEKVREYQKRKEEITQKLKDIAEKLSRLDAKSPERLFLLTEKEMLFEEKKKIDEYLELGEVLLDNPENVIKVLSDAVYGKGFRTYKGIIPFEIAKVLFQEKGKPFTITGWIDVMRVIKKTMTQIEFEQMAKKVFKREKNVKLKDFILSKC